MTRFGTYRIRRDPDESGPPRDRNIRSIVCDDLNAKIESVTADGFRLDMIMPADFPVTADMSRGDERIRISRKASATKTRNLLQRSERTPSPIHAEKPDDGWIAGRAGMMYRDLIPGRLGGKLVASHIRLTESGAVPDYVHYHKVRFQMIYCVRGAIKVVYEDQGEPFLLGPGDCVLQPPEIRHRVLWAEAGSEVVELGIPAIHETWVEHEMHLPTVAVNTQRVYSGQRFVRHIAAEFSREAVRDTGIFAATDGFSDVWVVRTDISETAFEPSKYLQRHDTIFCFVLSGGLMRSQDGASEKIFAAAGDAFIVSNETDLYFKALPDSEMLLAGF